jgi:excisionase family DNA binding protein
MEPITHIAGGLHDEPWRGKRDIAAFFDISVRSVERMVAAGMPSRKIGGQRRFRLSEVDGWVRSRASAAEAGV